MPFIICFVDLQKNNQIELTSTTFSTRVKELRKFMNWKQTDLSITTGFKREYISRVERKVNDPQMTSVTIIILKGFGITEKEFYSYGTIPESLKIRKELQDNFHNK